MSALLAKALQGGKASVYLLHGEEAFLTRRAFEWLRQTVLAGAPEDFNLDRFDARDKPGAERIVDAARTLPMMAERRLVWVKNAEVLFAAGVGETTAPLVRYAEKADPSSCLVLMAMTAVDKRGKLYKAIDKHGLVHESKTPYERELVGWILDHAKGQGRTLTRDAATLLVAAIGRDLAGLDTALERLSLFVPAPAPIDASHVTEVVAHTRAHTVWELVDAVADRNLSAALMHAHDLLGQGEPALKVLSLVADRFRKLVLGRSARAQGASPQEAAQAAGIPPFLAQNFARQLDRYDGRELLAALDRVAQTDRALKSSKLPDDLILEGLLIDLCAPSR